MSLIPESELDPNSGLFGFESWRETIWGSSVLKELGCEIIITLKKADIYAINDDLKKIRG